jgi:hypothetical protein
MVAVGYLRRYFGLEGQGYVGRWFDDWDSTGTREADKNVITSDDLVAVSLLSVEVPGPAAVRILRDDREQISELLSLIDDRHLVTVEPGDIVPEWPAWRLWTVLKHGADGIGSTIASKLLARKRPLLLPIQDSVVVRVIGPTDNLWASLAEALREDDESLHKHLIRLRTVAGLPEWITPLRVFDVVTWMEGKQAQA